MERRVGVHQAERRQEGLLSRGSARAKAGRTGVWLSWRRRRGTWSNGSGIGEASWPRAWGLKAKLKGLDLVLWALGSPVEYGSTFRWVCVGGDRRGRVECELHGHAETCSQVTAIVQAKEGEACAKWCEEEVKCSSSTEGIFSSEVTGRIPCSKPQV